MPATPNGRAGSEDTAQGQESESQNARGVIICFQTLIYADLSFRGDLFKGLPANWSVQNRHGTQT